MTGDVGPIYVPVYPADEIAIEGIPRANYSLSLEFRYRWINRTGAQVTIGNPPGIEESQCVDGGVGTDLDSPGCAFELADDASRYSGWSEIETVTIPGRLSPVDDVTIPLPERAGWGLRAFVGDMMVVAGVSPENAGTLSGDNHGRRVAGGGNADCSIVLFRHRRGDGQLVHCHVRVADTLGGAGAVRGRDTVRDGVRSRGGPAAGVGDADAEKRERVG